MITQTQLEQLRIEVSHAKETHKISSATLADALTELWCWRGGGITEEMLRAKDGYIKIGRGCIIATEEYISQRSNVQDQRRREQPKESNAKET